MNSRYFCNITTWSLCTPKIDEKSNAIATTVPTLTVEDYNIQLGMCQKRDFVTPREGA